LTVLRPADAAEAALAWELAAANLDGPTALVLSRQDLPVFGGDGIDDARQHGARTIVNPADGEDRGVEVVLAASGSEVALAVQAAGLLAGRGVGARVVSVPWRERFEQARRVGDFRLPDVPVVWIEAGAPTGWRAVAGPHDAVVGIERFGQSGKGREVAEHLGLSAEAVARVALGLLGQDVGGEPDGA
jgi:transketolase